MRSAVWVLAVLFLVMRTSAYGGSRLTTRADSVARVRRLSTALAENPDVAFQEWMQEHNKTYTELAEYERRLGNFQNNLRECEQHNAMNHSYWLGINQYSDLNQTEFIAAAGGYTPPSIHPPTAEPFDMTGASAPLYKNWIAEGKVGPVLDQGACGACWAFTAALAIETTTAIFTNSSPNSFSVQQMVDCSVAQGNAGCTGGNMQNAFAYVLQNGGLTSAAIYPYTGQQATCSTIKARHRVVSIERAFALPPGDQNALISAVANTAVSVAIAGSSVIFQNYAGGMMTDAAGCGTNIDHAVTVVGYDRTNTTVPYPYWIIQNSWGQDWGDRGYMYLKMETTPTSPYGVCGLLSAPSFPWQDIADPPAPPLPPSPPPSPPGAAGAARPVLVAVLTAALLALLLSLSS